MQILKFGGTSVGSAARMQSLTPLITKSTPAIVVLSAMSGTTNSLLEISNLISHSKLGEVSDKIEELQQKYKSEIKQLYTSLESIEKANRVIALQFDSVRSFLSDVFNISIEKNIIAKGEVLSTTLFHLYLEEIGVSAVLLSALDFMRIDENQEPDLNYLENNLKRILAKYPDHSLFITQGFICRNHFGEIDNLKRGGSDYTASLIGAAIDAENVQIWTDIDGMHNNDPRVVDKTHPIDRLSFNEAAELAYFGAKILHPTCILPAQKKNIPVHLLNTMQPSAKGTIISDETSAGAIKAVAAKDGITAINIKSDRMLMAYGFLRSVFEVFERFKTPIDMITTSEVALSLTIDNDSNLDNILEELNSIGHVTVDREQTIICIVGDFSGEKAGYASQVFEALKTIPIRMISYGGSTNNISVLVESSYKKDALISLNQGLFNY
ncbi:MAG: hypothetical protein RL204_1275 [Bacteroidota bacterium]|jgi:aspartate kinase